MQNAATDQPTLLIIGAGVAGLTAGCYAQMAGFRSAIFEMHHLPGGLCTAWDRQGYRFDGCIHYLFGTKKGEPFHQIWEELGVLADFEICNHHSLMQIKDEQGHALTVFADPDRLQAHLLSIGPEDEREILQLCDAIRLFTKFDMASMQTKPKEQMTLSDWQAFGKEMLPFAFPLLKWGKLSATEFGDRFENRFLRRAVPQMFGWTDIPMMGGIALLAYMHKQNAGFPLGGSLAFAQALEKRYLELGGQIHYNTQVEKILTQNDMAVGLHLYNDESHYGDYIISCADGHSTIFELLDGQYVSSAVQRIYKEDAMPILSQIQVSYGVDRDFSAEHHWTTYLLDRPLEIADRNHYAIGVKHYGFDPSLAPPGKSSVIVMLRSDYDYWQRIYGRKLYDLEQIKVANQVADFIETQHPGFIGAVEVRDVATPLSYERYTGNHFGSTCGWLLTDETMFKMVRGIRKRLPGLANFYMAGQWVEPGGSVPIVAMSGRNAILMACEDADISYEVIVP